MAKESVKKKKSLWVRFKYPFRIKRTQPAPYSVIDNNGNEVISFTVFDSRDSVVGTFPTLEQAQRIIGAFLRGQLHRFDENWKLEPESKKGTCSYCEKEGKWQDPLTQTNVHAGKSGALYLCDGCFDKYEKW